MQRSIKRRLIAALALVAAILPASLAALSSPSTVAGGNVPAAVVSIANDVPQAITAEADPAPDAAEVVDAPAWTLVAYSDCPAGQSCLWTGENGAGARTNFGFSAWGPPGTCKALNLQPIGGWHSGKGGYGSGYDFVLYTDSSCNNLLAVLSAGQTWSNSFARPYSMMII